MVTSRRLAATSPVRDEFMTRSERSIDSAQALNDLAYVESCAGNAELALRYSTDALASCGDFVDVLATMDLRNDVTRLLIGLARFDVAEERAREMLVIARERDEDVLRRPRLAASRSDRCAPLSFRRGAQG